jgi:hypothetical protein
MKNFIIFIFKNLKYVKKHKKLYFISLIVHFKIALTFREIINLLFSFIILIIFIRKI